MSIKTGVYNEAPFWSDSFSEDELNAINEFARSFKNPVKVIESDGGIVNLYQRIYGGYQRIYGGQQRGYGGSDERRIVIKKVEGDYYVITHHNNQYLNSYKLNSLSELYNLPDLHLRNQLFI